MKKSATLACFVVLGACIAPGLSSAASAVSVHRLTAVMTPRQVVTPTNKPAAFPAAMKGATGTFTGTTSADGRTLKWKVTYANLGAPALVIADIHIGKPGKFGPILMRVCGPCKRGQSGVIKLKSGYAARLATSDQWVTLITEKYPNGIVRGQIKVG